MKEITDPGKQGHKKKTKQNQIHKKPTPAGAGKKRSSLATSREYAHSRAESSSADCSRPKNLYPERERSDRCKIEQLGQARDSESWECLFLAL